jgi:hypothetical protein
VYTSAAAAPSAAVYHAERVHQRRGGAKRGRVVVDQAAGEEHDRVERCQAGGQRRKGWLLRPQFTRGAIGAHDPQRREGQRQQPQQVYRAGAALVGKALVWAVV